MRAGHASLHRWAQRFAPEIERRVRQHLRPTGRAWRVGETYVRVGGGGGGGGGGRAGAPRLVATGRPASRRAATGELKRGGRPPRRTRHPRGRWLNNRAERDHRRVKRRARPVLGFRRSATARRAPAGVGAAAVPAKGRARAAPARAAPARRAVVHRPFGLAA